MYRVARLVLRLLIPLRIRLTAEGTGRVPATGPFFLVANHESLLDALLVQVSCPRTVHTMTKSSQFRGLWSAFLVRLNAFPTRRYRVDAQAARTALRLLAEGEGVGVYPEGERSWDGRLQPLRRGAVRLLLKPGVPVVPCAVSGSYHRLPRWSQRLARGEVTVRFGTPLELGAHHGPEARRRALPGAMERLREALEELRASDVPGEETT